MRGAKAKRLRRLAERCTENMPNTLYMMNERTGQVKLDPRCTRAFYQAIKNTAS